MSGYSLGVDIGGTFTDIVVYDHGSGRQWSRKVLTTHDDPARGVIAGLKAVLREDALDPRRFQRVVHATTLFTNALIERKGAPTGLVTTEGFRDALEIGRERKYELYDLAIESPPPLVPRDARVEVAERVMADGSVRRALDRAGLETAVARLVARGIRALAIVFLHSYRNPVHEEAARELIAARFPGLFVTISSEVVREIREYERGSTTVANAYVMPLAQRYLEEMAAEIAALGITAPLWLMLSNGGLTHVGEATRRPVQMLESGPAAGALAAAFFGAADSDGNVLAFDMGGTTAKLSLIDAGQPLVAYGFEAARQKRFVEGSGLPIRISALDLIEIGAGGGSIARTDEIGLLKVGPESAGSEPGPACYGRGGTEPTVTDANFYLGYLNPDYFAGGTLAIDRAAAEAALDVLSHRLGLTPTETAWGIYDVVNENMVRAARVHVAERGRDPRRYQLVLTGGGGPVHGYYVSRKLGLRRLIVPPSAGVASAFGLLVAPLRVDRVATVGFRLGEHAPAALEAQFRAIEDEARRTMAGSGLALEALQIDRLVDGRYVGQGFELTVKLPSGPYDAAPPEAMRQILTAAFETGYRLKFARTPEGVPIEFTNIRAIVRASVPGAAQIGLGIGGAPGDPLKGRRRAYFAELRDFVETPVYDRSRLVQDRIIEGPALVEEEGSTLVVGPRGRFRVAASGNIIVEVA
ncbi:MAG: hydantoinase/oxoprolinase family protein [Alphaproteobacteria bacterium]|nr:hydantoinase/oxoprolinase family protein [Alphaproteobacteria bacterium]